MDLQYLPGRPALHVECDLHLLQLNHPLQLVQRYHRQSYGKHTCDITYLPYFILYAICYVILDWVNDISGHGSNLKSKMQVP